MTVCGIKQADGVCVMGKCPYVKICCPAVWDKSGEPMTNEEYLRTANVDDMATMIATKLLELARHEYGMCDVVDREIVLEWLKQPHNAK